MRNRTLDGPTRLFALVATIALTLGLMAPAYAVTATPAVVSFDDYEESARIKLEHYGQPIAANDINGWNLMVSGNTYGHMLDVSFGNGYIDVSPSTMAEIGNYDLIVYTDLGQVTIDVHTPLSDLPDSLENRAQDMGMSVEQLENRLGETEVLWKDTEVIVGDPAVAYVGEPYALEAAEEGVVRTWYIDGEAVDYPQGETVYYYTFDDPGIYAVGYEDIRDGETVKRLYRYVTVTGEPAVRYIAVAGEPVTIIGPTGYQDYDWTVDGKPVEAEAMEKLVHTFETDGIHMVELEATDPFDDSWSADNVTYVVEIQ